MKKKNFKIPLLVVSVFNLGLIVIPNNSVFASENSSVDVSNTAIYSDDEYYYILDESNVLTRTWSKPQSWSILKDSRTYLGIETRSRGTKLSISTDIFGMKIELGRTTSASGQFKKYRQNAKITVTYRVYRKIDNKYIRTQTSTANTQYIDYIPI